jgi:dihydroxy-acid dehydratase
MSSSSDTEQSCRINKYSKTLTQDPTQPAAQAMLYGIGLN